MSESRRAVEGILDNRLPQTDALVGQTLTITLEHGEVALAFDDLTVAWQLPDGTTGRDRYDAVELIPGRHFIDIWLRGADQRRALTVVLSAASGHALCILTTATPDAPAPMAPFVHDFASGTIAGVSAVPASAPTTTREMLGWRVLSYYSPDIVFEQIYLNPRSMAWQCLRGRAPGDSDIDEATYWRFEKDLYILGFREAAARSSSVFVLDLARGRSTGKFLGFDDDGALVNGALGARLEILSTGEYPGDLQPL